MKGHVIEPEMLAKRWSAFASVVRGDINGGRLRAFYAGVHPWRICLEDVSEHGCPWMAEDGT